jgi:hypothetical protein
MLPRHGGNFRARAAGAPTATGNTPVASEREGGTCVAGTHAVRWETPCCDVVTPLLLSCCTRSVVLYAACHLVALEVGPCTALTCVTRIHARHGTARVNATWHAACSTQHETKRCRACSGLTPSLLTRLEATAQRGDGDGDGDGEAASARRPHHRLRLTPEVGTAARLFAAAPFREGEGENSFTALARRQRMGGGCGTGPERRRAALS